MNDIRCSWQWSGETIKNQSSVGGNKEDEIRAISKFYAMRVSQLRVIIERMDGELEANKIKIDGLISENSGLKSALATELASHKETTKRKNHCLSYIRSMTEQLGLSGKEVPLTVRFVKALWGHDTSQTCRGCSVDEFANINSRAYTAPAAPQGSTGLEAS